MSNNRNQQIKLKLTQNNLNFLNEHTTKNPYFSRQC